MILSTPIIINNRLFFESNLPPFLMHFIIETNVINIVIIEIKHKITNTIPKFLSITLTFGTTWFPTITVGLLTESEHIYNAKYKPSSIVINILYPIIVTAFVLGRIVFCFIASVINNKIPTNNTNSKK